MVESIPEEPSSGKSFKVHSGSKGAHTSRSRSGVVAGSSIVPLAGSSGGGQPVRRATEGSSGRMGSAHDSLELGPDPASQA